MPILITTLCLLAPAAEPLRAGNLIVPVPAGVEASFADLGDLPALVLDYPAGPDVAVAEGVDFTHDARGWAAWQMAQAAEDEAVFAGVTWRTDGRGLHLGAAEGVVAMLLTEGDRAEVVLALADAGELDLAARRIADTVDGLGFVHRGDPPPPTPPAPPHERLDGVYLTTDFQLSPNGLGGLDTRVTEHLLNLRPDGTVTATLPAAGRLAAPFDPSLVGVYELSGPALRLTDRDGNGGVAWYDAADDSIGGLTRLPLVRVHTLPDGFRFDGHASTGTVRHAGSDTTGVTAGRGNDLTFRTDGTFTEVATAFASTFGRVEGAAAAGASRGTEATATGTYRVEGGVVRMFYHAGPVRGYPVLFFAPEPGERAEDVTLLADGGYGLTITTPRPWTAATNPLDLPADPPEVRPNPLD